MFTFSVGVPLPEPELFPAAQAPLNADGGAFDALADPAAIGLGAGLVGEGNGDGDAAGLDDKEAAGDDDACVLG